MQSLPNKIILAMVLVSATAASADQAGIQVGEKPPAASLANETGGYVSSDRPWSLEDLQGKTHVVFYVAPSNSDDNQAASDAIKAKNFPDEKFQSWAIVNMAASFWPNAMIERKLQQKQEEFPRTTFVKDKRKVLVKAWQIADKSSDVLVFDPSGKLAYRHDGTLSAAEIPQLLAAIEKTLAEAGNLPPPNVAAAEIPDPKAEKPKPQ